MLKVFSRVSYTICPPHFLPQSLQCLAGEEMEKKKEKEETENLSISSSKDFLVRFLP